MVEVFPKSRQFVSLWDGTETKTFYYVLSRLELPAAAVADVDDVAE
jgi:hypothetical protein